MRKKKIFILLGHPDKETLSGSFADAYERGAREAGHEVRRTNLGDIAFDPILHHGYKAIQALEPDLLKVQENIRWAEHFVIFYPSWWSTMPAILKGLFDRIWLPNFAFHFKESGIGAGYFWKRLMTGKSARVFVMSDAQPLLARFVFGDTTNEIRKCILWFAGFRVRVKKIGPLKFISETRAAEWRHRFEHWGSGAH
ncbi:MAG: NAD(P)H-dependent oxidoreductase [Candidatus Taylorbacteria bacterium]|nr:NAD(P)H-dependent oxidoreductase [Candidatus Taylorbacteria bacterium]